MPEVVFCRSLQVGKRGKDVIGHKRALSRAAPDLYPWLGKKFTPYYGPRFAEAIGKWQRRKHMDVTKRIGPATHTALERARNEAGKAAFDHYAIALCEQYCQGQEETPEEKAIDAGFYWYGHRWTISYSQARPFQLGLPPWVPTRWDCSAFVTACYFAAGVKDPNGNAYNGIGYTGTLVQRGTRINKSEARPGDLFFYGFVKTPRPGFPYGAPTHVAIYVGDNMVLSNGSFPMGHYDYRYRSDFNQIRTYDMGG